MGTVRWLWRKFVTRPPRQFPHYFGTVLWGSMLCLFAFPFTLGFGDPWWWVWIAPWLALLAGFLWWYGWLPGRRPE